MNLENLKKALSGQPNFRFKQTHKAILVDLISDWNDNTTLPKPLREDLNKNCSLEIKSELFGSKTSETLKALITLEDDKKVETVLMKHEDGRATVCVSSQVGCPMKCSFCATGKMGYKRNLTVSEIVEQVLFWQRYLHTDEESPDRVTNVVYMGMGEPFLNYDNVMESIRLINDPDGFNIGARHISVSTCGLIDEINKFAIGLFFIILTR